jgi:hypothetical protein
MKVPPIREVALLLLETIAQFLNGDLVLLFFPLSWLSTKGNLQTLSLI